MLEVGFLRKNKKAIWQPESAFCAMFYIAKEFNVNLSLFSFEDIDFHSGMVRGIFLEKGKQVERMVPIPSIIDVPPLTGKDEVYVKELERYATLTRHSLHTTKMKTYNMLRREGTYRNILIPTYFAQSSSDIDSRLDQVKGRGVVKPVRGNRGRGVLKVFRDKGNYQIIDHGVELNLDSQQWRDFCRDQLGASYVIQPYICSRTKSGHPFDIRVHTRRGAGGKFQLHLYPRVGNRDGIISNLVTGGYSMPIERFLRIEFGDQWKKIHQSLTDLGQKFPDYYQNFYEVPLFDVGLAVGITVDDGQFHLHLFEVNTYIDGYFFEIEDAITHLEYYHYLSETACGKNRVLTEINP